MTKVILGLTMSLDGFTGDHNGSVGRMYSDMAVGNVQDSSIQNNEVMQKALASTDANTAQQALRADLVDELQIDIMSVLFGDSLRLFEHLGPDLPQLEKIKVVDLPVRTHLRFRVVK